MPNRRGLTAEAADFALVSITVAGGNQPVDHGNDRWPGPAYIFIPSAPKIAWLRFCNRLQTGRCR
jgi:hypothetical protein